MTPTTDQTVIIQAAFGNLRHTWGWLLALGLLFIILGTIGLGMSFAITMASMLFFGFLMLIGGGMQLGQAFKCHGWKSILWHVGIAILYVIGGIMFINDPTAASAILTFLFAGLLFAIGMLRILMAFHIKGVKGWWWPLLGGIASIILAILILAEWPSSGTWVIGLFIAIDMIMHGWSYIFIALAAKASAKLSDPTDDTNIAA